MTDTPQDDPNTEPVPPVGPSDVGSVLLDATLSPEMAAELDEIVGTFVDVRCLEDDGPRLMSATAAPPTGKTIAAYMRTRIGHTGRVRENVNDFTKWYYGDNTAASWCAIFVCYVYNHFGALSLLSGKVAYVPNIKSHVGSKWHTDRDKIETGDPVTFDFNHSGEPEHVGTFIEWQDGAKTRFTSIEGNTGSDVVALRTRYWYDVYGYVKPGLSSTGPVPPSKPTKVPVPNGTPVLKTGSTGTRVRQLQTALNITRAKKIGVDGAYGTQTASAVRAFQTAHKLTADGEYGERTEAALRKALA